MARSLAAFCAVAALLSTGCVPVTEPVGDIDKAEPDKTLVGTWTVTDATGLSKQLDIGGLTVDAPAVKGNPKGLMRAVLKQQSDDLWFFTTTIGKGTYVNFVIEPAGADVPKFGTEGGFAKWKEVARKRYFIFKIVRDGDTLTLDGGGENAVPAVMREAKIETDREKFLPSYVTPVGWLAKYLDKTGPNKIFDGTNTLTLKREKK